MKKLTYEFVKRFIEDKGGILLSEKYIDNHQKLNVRCNLCNEVWNPIFLHLKKGHWHKKCKSAKPKKYSIQFINDYIKEKGKCLSVIYKNYQDRLDFQCNCGNIFKSSFANVKFKGSWCRICAKQKRRNTNIERYGVGCTSQVAEFALKQAKSSNHCFVLFHWKTNKELICKGSYEKLVVEYLNKNHIEYFWQSEVFQLPNERTYRPDLFLIEDQKWIEIKGYMREKSKQKWDWFHKEYPTSELWDKRKLQEMEIL